MGQLDKVPRLGGSFADDDHQCGQWWLFARLEKIVVQWSEFLKGSQYFEQSAKRLWSIGYVRRIHLGQKLQGCLYATTK